MDVGGRLLRGLLTLQDSALWFEYKLKQDYFLGAEANAFTFIAEHLKSVKQLPQVETVLAQFPELPLAPEPPAYYLNQVEQRYSYRVVQRALTEVSTLMKAGNVDDTLLLLRDTVSLATIDRMRQQMANFGQESASIIIEEYYKTAKAGAMIGVPFGWPTLDSDTMGMFPGDLVSYVGRPAAGKTYMGLYSAHHAWWDGKKNILFMSMEMPTLPLMQRVAAMHTHVPISDLKHASLANKPVKLIEKVGALLLKAKDHPADFWIVDGNLTSTPDEIYALADQLQPDVVYIDGAYLLKSDNARLDRYTRVAENAEAIKKNTSRLKIPTSCSYQFSREASKKFKKSEDPGLEDIGYSDAIGQISSLVLGLNQVNSVETLKQRKVQVLKGREGATGEFDVKWDFEAMDFSEVMKKPMTGIDKDQAVALEHDEEELKHL